MNGVSSFASYPSLRDRVIFITGGGSGIGAAMVEQFCQQGARVAFVDIDAAASNQLVDKMAAECQNQPLFIECDLTNVPALQSAISAIQKTLGNVLVLVNNAARDDRHRFGEVTPEYWDRAMNVNLRHQFFAIQAVTAGMTEAGGGSIINMSSIAWMIPTTGFPVYATAKAAVIGLTRSMAHELAGTGIRINSVLPGAIMTERQRTLWWSPESEAKILESQCLKRSLVPEDVARLVLFLAADDSAAITNQSYIVDGGWM